MQLFKTEVALEYFPLTTQIVTEWMRTATQYIIEYTTEWEYVDSARLKIYKL